MADEFKVDMDDVLGKYEGCNGDKRLLRKHLEGNYEPWSEQETEILRNKDELGMKLLIEKRGKEDVDLRQKFLDSDE